MTQELRNRRVAIYGTAAVLVHLAVNIVHGAAHSRLQIGLTTDETAFVTMVILLAPLAAMALLWTSVPRAGLMLLALSMAGSLVFGFQHHFVTPGPDHVGEQGAGWWPATFAVTSWLLALIEAAGTCVGVYFLIRR